MADGDVAQALPLIFQRPDSETWELGEEAAKFLEQFDEPMSVVIIAGRYRSGKSFLLNQILAGGGFSVGHTVESHTKGLWVCNRPLEGVTEDGERVKVLVMDSEGLGATDKDAQYDTTIFALASLICSTLVFNGSSTINEDAIQALGFVANLTRLVRVRSKGDGDGEDGGDGGEGEGDALDELQRFFPSFTWVLRDFSLALVDADGQTISADEYMEDQLEPREGYDPDTQSRNRVRRALRTFFRNRRCFTLVRPVDSEEDLQRLDTIEERSLRPEFRRGVEQLRSHLLGHAKRKTVGDRPVTGPMLASLVRSYIGAINAGGVPTIGDAWDSAAAGQCRRLQEAACAALTTAAASSFELDLPVDSNDLRDAYTKALHAHLAHYDDEVPPGSGKAERDHREKIVEHGEELFREVEERNHAESEKDCVRLVRTLRNTHLAPIVRQAEQAATDTRRIASGAIAKKEKGGSEKVVGDSGDGGEEEGLEDDGGSGVAFALPDFPKVEFSEPLAKAWESVAKEYSTTARGPAREAVLLRDGLGGLLEASAAVARAASEAADARAGVLDAARNVERERATRLQEALAGARDAASAASARAVRSEGKVLELEQSSAALREALAKERKAGKEARAASDEAEEKAKEAERLRRVAEEKAVKAEAKATAAASAMAKSRDSADASSQRLREVEAKAEEDVRAAEKERDDAKRVAEERKIEADEEKSKREDAERKAEEAEERAEVEQKKRLEVEEAAAQFKSDAAARESDSERRFEQQRQELEEKLQEALNKAEENGRAAQDAEEVARKATESAKQAREEAEAAVAAAMSRAEEAEGRVGGVEERESAAGKRERQLASALAEDIAILSAQRDAATEQRRRISQIADEIARHSTEHATAAFAAAEAAKERAKVLHEAAEAARAAAKSASEAARTRSEAASTAERDALERAHDAEEKAKAEEKAVLEAQARASDAAAALDAAKEAAAALEREGEGDDHEAREEEAAEELEKRAEALAEAERLLAAAGRRQQALRQAATVAKLEAAAAAANGKRDAELEAGRASSWEERARELEESAKEWEARAQTDAEAAQVAQAAAEEHEKQRKAVVEMYDAEEESKLAGRVARAQETLEKLQSGMKKSDEEEEEGGKSDDAHGEVVEERAAAEARALAAEERILVLEEELHDVREKRREAEVRAAQIATEASGARSRLQEVMRAADAATVAFEASLSQAAQRARVAAETAAEAKLRADFAETSRDDATRRLAEAEAHAKSAATGRAEALVREREARREVERLSKEVEEQSKKATAAEARASAAEDALSTARAEVERLELALRTAEGAKQSAESRLQNAEREVAALREEASAARARAAKAEVAAATATGQAESLRSLLEKRLHDLSEARRAEASARAGAEGVARRAVEAVAERGSMLKRLRSAERALRLQTRRKAAVDAAIASCERGSHVTKFHSKGNFARRALRLSATADPDNILLQWGVTFGASRLSKLPLTQVRSVTLGHYSPTFQKLSADILPPLDCSFTVFTTSRSYDFATDDRDTALTWVLAIRALLMERAGYGRYALSPLALRFERARFVLEHRCASSGRAPREELDRLREEATSMRVAIGTSSSPSNSRDGSHSPGPAEEFGTTSSSSSLPGIRRLRERVASTGSEHADAVRAIATPVPVASLDGDATATRRLHGSGEGSSSSVGDSDEVVIEDEEEAAENDAARERERQAKYHAPVQDFDSDMSDQDDEVGAKKSTKHTLRRTELPPPDSDESDEEVGESKEAHPMGWIASVESDGSYVDRADRILFEEDGEGGGD